MSADEEETKSPEEIEAEIERTRADLGDTVAAAADKADVKKQAKKKATEVKEQVQAKAADLKDQAADQIDDLKDKAPGSGDGEGGFAPGVEPYLPDDRQQPLIVGGALLAGFILGRMTVRRR